MRLALPFALAVGFALPIFAGDVNQEVKKLMENEVKKPGKALKSLAKAKKFTDPTFATELEKLIKASDKLKGIKHKDKEFNDMSADMATALAAVKAAVEKKDFAAAEKSWGEVTSSCASCHKKYE
ncbi:MAG: Cytochrome [Verrucomicrobiota bacterium]|jgi:cytochrome c556